VKPSGKTVGQNRRAKPLGETAGQNRWAKKPQPCTSHHNFNTF